MSLSRKDRNNLTDVLEDLLEYSSNETDRFCYERAIVRLSKIINYTHYCFVDDYKNELDNIEHSLKQKGYVYNPTESSQFKYIGKETE